MRKHIYIIYTYYILDANPFAKVDTGTQREAKRTAATQTATQQTPEVPGNALL